MINDLCVKDIAIDRPANIVDLAQGDFWFNCEINKPNISPTSSVLDVEIESGWPEVILLKVGTQAAPEQKLYGFSLQGMEELKEEGKGFNLYGNMYYGAVSGKGEYPFSGAYSVGQEIQIGAYTGAASFLSIGGKLFSIGWHTRTASDEIKLPESLERHLSQLSRLTENWDSYHAKRISDKAIKKAESLLISVSDSLGERRLEDVFIAPCSDGGLQLEWKIVFEKELIVKISHGGKAVNYLITELSQNGTFIEREGDIEEAEEWKRLLDELIAAGDLR